MDEVFLGLARECSKWCTPPPDVDAPGVSAPKVTLLAGAPGPEKLAEGLGEWGASSGSTPTTSAEGITSFEGVRRTLAPETRSK